MKMLENRSLEEIILDAFIDEAKRVFGKEIVSLEELESILPNVSKADQLTRGVLMYICHGPDGVIAIHVASSSNLYVRFLVNDSRIRKEDTSLSLYELLAQPGWTYTCKVLARFPHDTHQSLSYILEALAMMVCGALDNTQNYDYHNDWSIALAMRVVEEVGTIFDFVIKPLNQSSPLLSGWSLADVRAKVCPCGNTTAQEAILTLPQAWHPHPLDPFGAWHCNNCHIKPNVSKYYARVKDTSARTQGDQLKLKNTREAFDVRGLLVRGEKKVLNPLDCDWCGKVVAKPGERNSHGIRKATVLNTVIGLCLCPEDHYLMRRYGVMPAPGDVVGEGCGLCGEKQTLSFFAPKTRLRFVPYPVKAFLCVGCLGGKDTIYNELIASTKLADRESRKPTYLTLVAMIQSNPSLIHPNLARPEYLRGDHHALLAGTKAGANNKKRGIESVEDSKRRKHG